MTSEDLGSDTTSMCGVLVSRNSEGGEASLYV